MTTISQQRSRWRARLETLATVAVMIAVGVGMFFVGQTSRPSRSEIRATLTEQRAQDARTHAATKKAALADQREVLANAHKPSAAQTTASTAPPAEPTVTEITVDELVDKLNSPSMGGIKVGDQFRVTAELVGSDFWGTGASGDFSVMLKTKDGADLIVFVDESDADGWQDGTQVEMVVEMVEATINGETTDGWLEVQSAKTISGGTTSP